MQQKVSGDSQSILQNAQILATDHPLSFCWFSVSKNCWARGSTHFGMFRLFLSYCVVAAIMAILLSNRFLNGLICSSQSKESEWIEKMNLAGIFYVRTASLETSKRKARIFEGQRIFHK